MPSGPLATGMGVTYQRKVPQRQLGTDVTESRAPAQSAWPILVHSPVRAKDNRCPQGQSHSVPSTCTCKPLTATSRRGAQIQTISVSLTDPVSIKNQYSKTNHKTKLTSGNTVSFNKHF